MPSLPRNTHGLDALGLDKVIVDNLRSLSNRHSEIGMAGVVAAYLYYFLQRCTAADGLSRNARRAITKAYNKRCSDPAIIDEIAALLALAEPNMNESWHLKAESEYVT